MTRPVRLRPTAAYRQFADDAGALWIRNDGRSPGSNPPEEIHCGVCGGLLGPVTYARQRTGGAVACALCVEVEAPTASDSAQRAVYREEGSR